MKTSIFVAILLTAFGAALPGSAQETPEPTVYVVQQGDTLWGLSDRFFKDPFYWPSLWSKNRDVGNPHFIYPGQKLRIFPDRVEVVPPETPKPEVTVAQPSPPPPAEPAKEIAFTVTGGEGIILEEEHVGVGRVVATNHDRVMVGTGDTLYTDIGSPHARPGDRFSLYEKKATVTHPTQLYVIGYKIIPLGTVELTELTKTGSRGTVTSSYREISKGAYLLPWQDRRREIPLKSTKLSLNGFIIDSLPGIKAIGAGEVVYIDLGKKQGLEVGNLLYAVRTVKPDREFDSAAITLPDEVLGALLVVYVRKNVATAIVLKSAETIFVGDRVVTVLPGH